MYNLNLAVVSLFGFHKSEILNRNVKALMPILYSIHHDSFIENYVNNKDSKLFNKERLVFGKNKSGYALPLYLMIKVFLKKIINFIESIIIKPIHSLIHGIQLFGTFKVEKNIRLIGYILTDVKGVIETITPCKKLFFSLIIMILACYTILRSDLKQLSGKSIETQVLFS